MVAKRISRPRRSLSHRCLKMIPTMSSASHAVAPVISLATERLDLKQPLRTPGPGDLVRDLAAASVLCVAVIISVTKEGVKFSTAGDIWAANIVCRQNKTVDMVKVELGTPCRENGCRSGKKIMVVRIIKHAMEIIHLLTNANSIQIIVDAIIHRVTEEAMLLFCLFPALTIVV